MNLQTTLDEQKNDGLSTETKILVHGCGEEAIRNIVYKKTRI